MPNFRSVAQIEGKKHPHILFSTFGPKRNEFEQKKLEMNERIDLKFAGNYSNIYTFNNYSPL